MRGILIAALAVVGGASFSTSRWDQQPESAPASSADPVVVTRADGGAMRVSLRSLALNDKSKSLRREWIAIADERMPARIKRTPGITVIYDSKEYGGRYLYTATYDIEATEPLSAIEVRFICFDVWGQHTKSLSTEQVIDIPVDGGTGKQAPFTFSDAPRWNIFSENEASSHYASIAYVSRVRTQSGRVVECDPTPVVAEAKKLSSKFTEAALDPSPPTQPK